MVSDLGGSNLFLADGAPFPSNADKNPTLTIMANAWRVGDHIVGRMRQTGAVMDRRETIKWMLAASAVASLSHIEGSRVQAVWH